MNRLGRLRHLNQRRRVRRRTRLTLRPRRLVRWIMSLRVPLLEDTS